MITDTHFSQRFLPRLLWQLIWIGFIGGIVGAILVFGAMTTPLMGSGRLWGMLSANFVSIAMLVPATVVIVAGGGIDLSIAGVACLTAVIFANACRSGMSSVSAFILALLVAVAVGLFNAALIGLARIHSIIVTMGTGFMLTGIAYELTNGFVVQIPQMTGGENLMTVLNWLALFIVTAGGIVVLECTSLGRQPTAADENQKWHSRSLLVGGPFVASSLAAGLYGLTMAFRLQSASPQIGLGLEFNILAVVIMGGTIFGGRCGNILAGILAAMGLVLVDTITTLANTPVFVTHFVVRGILLLVFAGLGWGYYVLFNWAYKRRLQRRCVGFPVMVGEKVM